MKVKVGGTEINLTGESSGKPALLAVHGAGGGAWMWEPLRKALAPDVDVIAIDLPGHGDSSGSGETTVARYSEIVRAACKAAGIEKPFATGHSMGGAVALDWAINAPDELSGLVLFSTGARLKVHPMVFDAIDKNFESYVAMSRKMAFGAGIPEDTLKMCDEALLKMKPDIVAGDFKACDAFDVMSSIGTINKPTIILCGSNDNMTPAKYSQFLTTKIAGSKIEIFEGAGHMLPIERPVEAASVIRKFVSESRSA